MSDRVWVLQLYQGRGFYDITVHRTEAGAERAMAEMARENFEDWVRQEQPGEELQCEVRAMIAESARHRELLVALVDRADDRHWFVLESTPLED